MEHISNLLNISPQPSEQSKTLPSLDLAEKIWVTGAAVFGDKWKAKHGDLPSGEWFNVLCAFDELQIDVGLKRMRKDAEHKIRAGDEAWPPASAFEFACYCKTNNPLYFHSPVLPPPAKVSTPKYAKERLAEIKRMLRGEAE